MRVKKSRVALFVSIGLLFVCGVALAKGAMGGTGLFNIPSADVVGTGGLTLGYRQWGGDGLATLNYGFLDNLEVGASTLNPQEGGTELLGHVKLQLAPEDRDMPALAVGLQGDSYYVAASKELYHGLRGHVGLGSGRFDGLFMGASVVLNPVSITTDKNSWSLPVATVMAEYDGEHPNVGLKLGFTPELELSLAAKDLKELNLGVGFTTRF
jgi:hypothetical protein